MFDLIIYGKKLSSKTITLVASGDLRFSANKVCWPAQLAMEHALRKVVAELGYELVRAHPYKPKEKHGFISSQKEGIEVFSKIDPLTRVIVAEAVWQYASRLFYLNPQFFRGFSSDPKNELLSIMEGYT